MSKPPPSTLSTTSRLEGVSIIIPCFNHARYLAEAIESARSQSARCEVIVVDDGSTDASGDIARRYPDVVVLTQTNRGLAAARNAGFEASRGELVIFLDADDRLSPHAARLASATFAAHPDAAMVFGRCRVVDADGLPHPTQPVTRQVSSYDELLRDNCIWTPAMAAFRRSVVDRVGRFDETNSPAADYDLYLRISRDFPVVSHDAVVVDYRQHGDNMSCDPVLMLEATLNVLRAQRRVIAGDRANEAVHREAVVRWRALYGERLVERFRDRLRRRQFGKACRDALHLLRLYPAGVRHHVLKKLGLVLRGGEPQDSVADIGRP